MDLLHSLQLTLAEELISVSGLILLLVAAWGGDKMSRFISIACVTVLVACAALAVPADRPVAAVAPPSRLDVMSRRELDILRGIARGQGNKEIARSLGIAETTVKIHVQHVLRKLDVSSRVQAAVLATTHGLA